MARRPMDLQIFWVVVFGLGFWAAVWFHNEVLDGLDYVWKIIQSLVERA